MQEIELKFLNIDVEALEKKLMEVGAEFVGEDFLKSGCFGVVNGMI